MYKIAVNGSSVWKVDRKKEQLLLNDKPVTWSCESLADGSFSVLHESRSYHAELLEMDRAARTMTLRVEGETYVLQITGQLDELLASMGLKERGSKKATQIKAPMPGLVLKILVTEQQRVQKGDPVLILEAMKMENVFKSPEDALVKEIRVSEKSAVEKGQVLMVLE